MHRRWSPVVSSIHQLNQLDLLSESEPSWRGAEILWSVAWRPTRLMVLVEKIELKLSACSAIDKFPTSWRCEKREMGASSDVQDVSMITVQRMYSWFFSGLINTVVTHSYPGYPQQVLPGVFHLLHDRSWRGDPGIFCCHCCHCCCVSLPHSGPAGHCRDFGSTWDILGAEIWIRQILCRLRYHRWPHEIDGFGG